jgi:flagellin
MPLNSVNTNIGAQVALQSLNLTTTQLQATQKRISTGYRVADATDDGAAFAVAQRVRSDVGALTTVNQQLGNAKGLVGVANTGLTNVSNYLTDAKSLLVDIANAGISQDQRDQYVASYKSLVTRVANTVDGATYNGQTLLGSATGAVAGSATSVINNEVGATSAIAGEDVSGLANTLASFIGSTFSRTTAGVDTFGTITAGNDKTAAATALSATTGTTAFAVALKGVSDQLNQVGNDAKFLDATITSNNAKIDSLNAGLGALVDTDLSKESANLQALQIRQQLGTQALSLSNQAPQTLLSLFK